MALHPEFLTIPIAHRGLHDLSAGIPECSATAFQSAIDHGYGIELDVQESSDGKAIVIHDATLDRLTNESGAVRARTAAQLGDIKLKGGTDKIQTLADVLELVSGQVPLLIEIKDQDGDLGTNIGNLSADIARVLMQYTGPVGVMSYNSHAAHAVAMTLPETAIGLVTSGPSDTVYAHLTARQRNFAVEMMDFDRIGACFISHNRTDLQSAHVANIRRRELPVLSWTIRNKDEEKQARKYADNITFEGYLA